MTADQAARLPFPLAPVTVVTGHYGVGKTNFALNLALDAAAAGRRATLADMDVVNPYFRSNEYRDLLEGAGVRLIAPVFDILGTVPGYREYDISFWFLGFFTLFFAMIIGDAGYGCLFLLTACLLYTSPRPRD